VNLSSAAVCEYRWTTRVPELPAPSARRFGLCASLTVNPRADDSERFVAAIGLYGVGAGQTRASPRACARRLLGGGGTVNYRELRASTDCTVVVTFDPSAPQTTGTPSGG